MQLNFISGFWFLELLRCHYYAHLIYFLDLIEQINVSINRSYSFHMHLFLKNSLKSLHWGLLERNGIRNTSFILNVNQLLQLFTLLFYHKFHFGVVVCSLNPKIIEVRSLKEAHIPIFEKL